MFTIDEDEKSVHEAVANNNSSPRNYPMQKAMSVKPLKTSYEDIDQEQQNFLMSISKTPNTYHYYTNHYKKKNNIIMFGQSRSNPSKIQSNKKDKATFMQHLLLDKKVMSNQYFYRGKVCENYNSPSMSSTSNSRSRSYFMRVKKAKALLILGITESGQNVNHSNSKAYDNKHISLSSPHSTTSMPIVHEHKETDTGIYNLQYDQKVAVEIAGNKQQNAYRAKINIAYNDNISPSIESISTLNKLDMDDDDIYGSEVVENISQNIILWNEEFLSPSLADIRTSEITISEHSRLILDHSRILRSSISERIELNSIEEGKYNSNDSEDEDLIFISVHPSANSSKNIQYTPKENAHMANECNVNYKIDAIHIKINDSEEKYHPQTRRRKRNRIKFTDDENRLIEDIDNDEKIEKIANEKASVEVKEETVAATTISNAIELTSMSSMTLKPHQNHYQHSSCNVTPNKRTTNADSVRFSQKFNQHSLTPPPTILSSSKYRTDRSNTYHYPPRNDVEEKSIGNDEHKRKSFKLNLPYISKLFFNSRAIIGRRKSGTPIPKKVVINAPPIISKYSYSHDFDNDIKTNDSSTKFTKAKSECVTVKKKEKNLAHILNDVFVQQGFYSRAKLNSVRQLNDYNSKHYHHNRNISNFHSSLTYTAHSNAVNENDRPCFTPAPTPNPHFY